AQLAGIENAGTLLRALCRGEIEAFRKAGLLTVSGEDDGFIISFTAEMLASPEFMQCMQISSAYLLQEAGETDLAILQKNIEAAAEITRPDWYAKYIPDGRVRILQVIAVKPEMRGKGIFRKLISPVLAACDREAMPLVLQTHNPATVSIYEHFGFRVMESIPSDKIPLTCTCMLRTPEKKTGGEARTVS
ncbi:MAG: GNAT family N-acetyltransferase, partial [Methanocorpusculum sp.]|nr:GNAT family N-acetyltransferase [Methanocorpusculum sp.]